MMDNDLEFNRTQKLNRITPLFHKYSSAKLVNINVKIIKKGFIFKVNQHPKNIFQRIFIVWLVNVKTHTMI